MKRVAAMKWLPIHVSSILTQVPRRGRPATGLHVPSLVGIALAAAAVALSPTAARASCATPANAIEAENCLTGAPASAWSISGAGDSSIQGFATDISVNRGGTVTFKVKSNASAWRLDIYRMGYYQGNGARLVATVTPSVTLPQSQPACRTDATGLIDCGNWAVSASWAVPAAATSGIYFARAVRTDTGGASHIFFVVRDDASTSALLFQTSDSTWQAYNDYGGNNLYTGTSAGRAYKVSYNRPFHTAVFEAESWVFNAEYPMVRWLERNGYDVTYHTSVDADRGGSLPIKNHKVWLSNGHDEYWSGGQRANVEAALAAGVNLAFFSSNTVFWKTRWESSIDGSATSYRTLVCYKETSDNAVTDPADPPTWTGTWRDPRFSPPADGGRPENALVGTIFRINGVWNDAITVPTADGRMRFWRNTSIATLGAGQTATLAPGTLGAEVDVDEDNGFRPPGLFGLSTNPITTTSQYLLDYGSSYGAGSATHRMTLYKHASGALVFSAATYQWSWGLDANHDRSQFGSTTDVRMQQATVNLFADMGVQPTTPQAGLVPAAASTDVTPPTSRITSPAAGATVTSGTTVTVTGTAVDAAGGVVAGVEVSTDGGTTWHPASGRESWNYGWTISGTGTLTLRSRAVDDSGNRETPSAGITVTVAGSASACTSNCRIWPATAAPAIADGGPDTPVELGVKFRSDVAGSITGIRFYKATANTGTHAGNLWSSTGTRLATATFTAETASGWQQVTFPAPVAIAANTVYVASYFCPAGHYSADSGYFATKGFDNPPLHALQDGVSGADSVYAYGTTSAFPSQTYQSTNYWVDVAFTPAASLTSIAVTPAAPAVPMGSTQQFTATGTYSDGTTQLLSSGVTWASSNSAVATISGAGLANPVGAGTATISATVGAVVGSTVLTVNSGPLAITTASLPGGTEGVAYSATLSASGGRPPYHWSVSAGLPPTLSLNGGTGAISGTTTTAGSYTFTVQVLDAASTTASQTLTINVSPPGSYRLWADGTVPRTVDSGPDSAVEVGVRFKADQAGFISGIRFYKSSANTGTHVANLWSNTGTKLATATFTAETASGWQQVNFAAPVSIAAGTAYVASYHTNVGHYSADSSYFNAAWDNVPLHAPADGTLTANGVYAYGTTSAFPNKTFESTNYWVDVVFNPSAPVAVVSAIAVTPATSTLSAPATQQYTAVATYSDGSTFDVSRGASWSSSNTNVATMSSTGLATTVNAGTASITATFAGVAGSASLTVAAAPPQGNEGPDGPILVVSGSGNYYSRYVAEILRNEGFQEFLATDIASVTSATLAAYDLVVLGDLPLTANQATMFANWVNGGGNLIALHPDKQLAGLLGLTSAGGTLSDAYLRVDTTTAAGAGIVGQTIQFHGPADLYNLNGAQAIATLYSSAIASSGNPAVTLRTAGLGRAAAFTYDLARSVVYTRQGNPLWSGQSRDGLTPIRADDLFFGASASDPQPDWVDLNKVAIPQADEQQRLLANLIVQMNLGKKPLPRFWYLPSGFKAAVVMTGDDHSNGGTAGRWNGYIAASPAGCSVADWQCVRGTSYLYAVSPLTSAQAVSYTNQGFEVALHVTTNCNDFASSADLSSYYTDQLTTFASRYPTIPAPVTNRTHCIVWSDYDTQPQVELAKKIRLDTTYYYYPGTWVQDRPGFFTGSGWPMRYTDRSGRIVDVYQAVSQMTDESDQTYPKTIDALLDGAVGPNGFYGVFTANMHTDQVASAGSDAILASAKARGVPIVSAKQMLQWLDGRNGSSFGSLSWSANTLTFTVSAAAGARNLQAMLPTQVGALTLRSVTVGTTSVGFTTGTIKGISYATFPATTGSYRAVYQ